MNPVGLRMTQNPKYGLRILRIYPKILSSCRSTGQYDQIISCHSDREEESEVVKKRGF
jgi:hypothetical protein